MWKTINSAPRGTTKKVKAGKDGERDNFIREWVFGWHEGADVTMTYYIPKEDRWCGFTKNDPPTHWHPKLEPPTNL